MVVGVGLITCATALLAASPAGAAKPWMIRFQGAWSSPQGDFREVDGEEVITAEFADSFGFGLQVERLISGRIGLEFGVLWSEPDVELVIAEPPIRLKLDAPFSVTPITLGVNYHFGPGRSTDFYLGPVLAWVLYDDVVLSDPQFGRERLTVDDDYAWGVNLGIDVDLTQDGRWAFNSELRWMKGSADFKNPEGEGRSVDVDPLYLTAGVTYRF